MSKPTMTMIEGLARDVQKAREDYAKARADAAKAREATRAAEKTLAEAMAELTK